MRQKVSQIARVASERPTRTEYNQSTNQMITTLRTVSEIEADLKAAGIKRDNFRRIHNEGQGGYVDESEIERLSAELQEARKNQSPLTRDLAGERTWFNAQGFRCPSTANAACLKRGYSLAELQAASKSAK